ncbi:DUF2189 domain-containing protein [Bowmanella sp. JS7-9]|uniref:DUF2189 domain-containing protein n=1 Tax=Pseudobowmanella zhangzhouensis TaxID=1537679 RepID=A0ABW1XIG6_9ALTE|nr:DUF2189 domain-containing protein [Bowmanella sp. JS7-9]TBX27487.1 cytochrome B6 [Bowmanella sp. JS7-9]
MSQSFKQSPDNALKETGFARIIPCKQLDVADPLKWLGLGWRDAFRAPVITLFFGVLFTLAPWVIYYLVELTGWHLIILPSIVCFMLLGPFLAAGLYDVSWELEKGHQPSLWHSIKAINRNAVNEWAFGLLLLVIMIFWLRVSALIHALYPNYLEPNLANLMPFLLLGTVVGAGFTMLVFFISAFTQPILMERRVDLATAVLSSMNAVWVNKAPMAVWALIILTCVGIGFITYFFAFLILMPLIGYATWHGYIDTIETKRERHYD